MASWEGVHWPGWQKGKSTGTNHEVHFHDKSGRLHGKLLEVPGPRRKLGTQTLMYWPTVINLHNSQLLLAAKRQRYKRSRMFHKTSLLLSKLSALMQHLVAAHLLKNSRTIGCIDFPEPPHRFDHNKGKSQACVAFAIVFIVTAAAKPFHIQIFQPRKTLTR